MLGFGNAIPVGGAAWRLMDTYTSDFTGGGGDNSSDWGDSSVEGGSITFATNIDGIGGEDNWLRCTFPANQTTASGFFSSCNNFVVRCWKLDVVSPMILNRYILKWSLIFSTTCSSVSVISKCL